MKSETKIPYTLAGSLIISFLMISKPIKGQYSQEPKSAEIGASIQETDSSFIGKFERKNDARVFYGTQGLVLEYGSKREGTPSTSSRYSNVNDFLGFGLTYKFIDFDLSFSLPKTRLLNQDLQNLTQFRLSGSYTARKWVWRGSLSDMNGMVVSDPGGFESKPDVSQLRLALQMTYIFNYRKFSYRAAVYQSEFQRKTAGSFLLRFEPFYRTLGTTTRLVPASLDLSGIFGNQEGLEYVKAPGILVMPGYGATIKSVDGKFYVSPFIFAGPGIAFNFYKGGLGEFAYTNWEFGGMAALNLGYSNSRFYVNVAGTDEVNYSPINPAYFLSTNLRMTLTVGYRFYNLENVLPVF